MSFRIDIPETEEIRSAPNPESKRLTMTRFELMVDEWCEQVESSARNSCDDPDGERLKFFRRDMTLTVDCANPDAVDCLRSSLETHMDRMDTTLTEVYELVLERLESHARGSGSDVPARSKKRPR